MVLPRISLVIITYNSASYIPKLMEDLSRIEYPRNNLQIIFIDNASKDGTPYLTEKYAERYNLSNVKVIQLKKNLGFPAALNVAIIYTLRTFKPAFVVIMNPDIIIINRKFLKQLIEIMSRYDVCIASPLILHARTVPFDKIQWLVGLIDITGTAYMGGYKSSLEIVEKLNLNMPFLPTSWATFALAVINTRCLEGIGLPRPEFFLYYEDVEYSLRALSRGYIVASIIIPSIAHVESGAPRDAKMVNIIRVLFIRNSLIVTAMYLGLASLILKLIIYVFESLASKNKWIARGIFEALKGLVRKYNITLLPKIHKYLLITQNNILLLSIKYKSIDNALVAFSYRGLIEYIRNLRRMMKDKKLSYY